MVEFNLIKKTCMEDSLIKQKKAKANGKPECIF